MSKAIHPAASGAKLMPFWLDNAARPNPQPALTGRLRTDLLIVGGGFSGLWAALQAKEAEPDREVVLIEADRIGSGASGRAGGIVSTSVMHGLKNEAKFFPDEIEELERLGQENLDAFKATLERYEIDAEAEWTGEMIIAVDPGHVDELREEFELHKAYGHDVTFLDRGETAQHLISPMFEAAMWSRNRSGTVHPAKLAWGLRNAALKLGVKLFEHTPMVRVEERATGLVVHTREGRIEAGRVLFATNAWAAGHRAIKRRVMAMRDHVLATEPLTAEQLGRVAWRNRQGVYDTRLQLNYTRLTQDNRIVFGGSVGYQYDGGTDFRNDLKASTYAGLLRAFFETFPQLHDVRISHLWGGPIDFCVRYSAFLQSFYGDRAVYVGGYSGFGIAGSRFAARLALARLDRLDVPEMKLALTRQLPGSLPPEPFRWLGAVITLHLIDKPGLFITKLWMRLIKVMGFAV
jgi:glycine/D-amino acid oxidase-like deaminating enzyme